MLKYAECNNNVKEKKGRNHNAKKIWLFLITMAFLCMMFMGRDLSLDKVAVQEIADTRKYDGTWRNLNQEQKSKLSVLGRILYLEEEKPEQRKNNYSILFWKYGKYIKSRHLNHYTDEMYDPFETCSVKNCKVSFEDKELEKADIVIFHLHRMKGIQDLPYHRRNLDQIWTFLTDESPFNTFLNSKVKISNFNGKFNWSMSYRMDSDIPVPYGRTRKFLEKIALPELNENAKRGDRLVTILGSNCGGHNHRWQYVKRLNNSIHVDVYGGCGNRTACPGHFKSDCPAIDNYLFYLSFENTDCKEYITEKVFWNAYHKNSIPVIMGYDRTTYEQLLPPQSFLHVDDFATPKDLADYMMFLNSTGEYMKYFAWKNNYVVLNEHGYFKSPSYHFCRICEALNYNKKGLKVYNNLDEFWSKSKDCTMR